MKNLFIITLLILSFKAFSQINAQSGTMIKAQEYNSSTSQIGEIKQSLLI
jgi:hypothetical protein